MRKFPARTGRKGPAVALFPAALAILSLLPAIPLPAIAHTGGPLDPDGCHDDHRSGTYHCHRGEAAGYTFANKADMKEAVRTGDFPDKTVEAEGFFSKLWPFGGKHEQMEAPEEADGSGVESGSTASDATSASRTPEEEEAAQQLKVAQGLYEMGLLTKEEYEAKRQAIVAEP